jgi:hypothetical protein
MHTFCWVVESVVLTHSVSDPFYCFELRVHSPLCTCKHIPMHAGQITVHMALHELSLCTSVLGTPSRAHFCATLLLPYYKIIVTNIACTCYGALLLL